MTQKKTRDFSHVEDEQAHYLSKTLDLHRQFDYIDQAIQKEINSTQEKLSVQTFNKVYVHCLIVHSFFNWSHKRFEKNWGCGKKNAWRLFTFLYSLLSSNPLEYFFVIYLVLYECLLKNACIVLGDVDDDYQPECIFCISRNFLQNAIFALLVFIVLFCL